MALEYYYSKPVALIEYRRSADAAPTLAEPIYRALVDLANRYQAGIPAAIATYCPTTWRFAVEPLNEAAARCFPSGALMSEAEYVTRLHDIRRARISPAVLERLATAQPRQAASAGAWAYSDISVRHRAWGLNCPAVDVDFLVTENNYSKCVALFEYKRAGARIDANHPSISALAALCDGYADQLAFVLAEYCPTDWWFRYHRMNERALIHYRGTRSMCERDHVMTLFRLRQQVITTADRAAFSRLNVINPLEEVL